MYIEFLCFAQIDAVFFFELVVLEVRYVKFPLSFMISETNSCERGQQKLNSKIGTFLFMLFFWQNGHLYGLLMAH
jgi:hypothetical protein